MPWSFVVLCFFLTLFCRIKKLLCLDQHLHHKITDIGMICVKHTHPSTHSLLFVSFIFYLFFLAC